MLTRCKNDWQFEKLTYTANSSQSRQSNERCTAASRGKKKFETQQNNIRDRSMKKQEQQNFEQRTTSNNPTMGTQSRHIIKSTWSAGKHQRSNNRINLAQKDIADGNNPNSRNRYSNADPIQQESHSTQQKRITETRNEVWMNGNNLTEDGKIAEDSTERDAKILQ